MFLNVPFDRQFERLFSTYVSTLVGLGWVPHCVLPDDPAGIRLDRLFESMGSCAMSIHDLSRLNARPERANMPFELGMAVARELAERGQRQGHRTHLFDKGGSGRGDHRLDVLLSDLRGRDAVRHHGTSARLINGLCDRFETERSVDTDGLRRLDRHVWQAVNLERDRRGAATLFSASMFRVHIGVATSLVAELSRP